MLGGPFCVEKNTNSLLCPSCRVPVTGTHPISQFKASKASKSGTVPLYLVSEQLRRNIISINKTSVKLHATTKFNMLAYVISGGH